MGVSAPPHLPDPSWSFTAHDNADADSGADTDTSSSDGEQVYTCEDLPPSSNDEERVSNMFWAYQYAKGRWRRAAGNPIRRVRRFLKRHYGRNRRPHGIQSRSHLSYSYLAESADETLEHVFKGKGREGGSKGRRTTGKGFGRRGNPKDRSGNTMKCHECGSTDHLVKRCPQRKGKCKGKPANGKGTYLAQVSETQPQQPATHVNWSLPGHDGPAPEPPAPEASGPLDDIVESANPGEVTQVPNAFLQGLITIDMWMTTATTVEEDGEETPPGPFYGYEN